MPAGAEETTTACPCRDAATAANEAIRRHSRGRTAWTPEAIAELQRLVAAWRVAAARSPDAK